MVRKSIRVILVAENEFDEVAAGPGAHPASMKFKGKYDFWSKKLITLGIKPLIATLWRTSLIDPGLGGTAFVERSYFNFIV